MLLIFFKYKFIGVYVVNLFVTREYFMCFTINDDIFYKAILNAAKKIKHYFSIINR